jgi:hypothetical protein
VLAVVDIVLGIGANEIIVKGDFVLLEVGDGGMVDLEGHRADVNIVALHFALNSGDLTSQVGDLVHYSILGLE